MYQRNLALVLRFDVPAPGLDSRLNPFAACGGIPLQSKTRRGIWTLCQRNPKANGLGHDQTVCHCSVTISLALSENNLSLIAQEHITPLAPIAE